MGTTSIEQQDVALGDEVKMTFHRIPACPEGFLMGSRGNYADEEPIHRVVVPDDFWMGETPVTQTQFAVWTKSKRIKHENRFEDKPDHPAESMTWHQASDFCVWLTTRTSSKFPSDYRVATLPTEAHWEYACRAGSHTEYYTGDGEAALREAGHYDTDSTQPVRAREPNDFGLYDTHGNVREWCLDPWDEMAYRRRWDRITAEETLALNERFGDQSENPPRVVRGGSWNNTANRCRSAYRNRNPAGNSNRNNGFRVCLVRSPLVQQDLPASREQ